MHPSDKKVNTCGEGEGRKEARKGSDGKGEGREVERRGGRKRRGGREGNERVRLVSGLFVPRTIRTLDYSYYGWTIRTLDDSYDGLFVLWTVRTIHKYNQCN